MQNLKIYVDILKYKITLFSSILASGIYLLINKTSILQTVNEFLFYAIVGLLLMYGAFGFIVNFLKISKKEKELENE